MLHFIRSKYRVTLAWHQGIYISRTLKLSGPGVTKCVEKGKNIIFNDENLRNKLIINQSIIVYTLRIKSLLPSLYKREEFPSLEKRG